MKHTDQSFMFPRPSFSLRPTGYAGRSCDASDPVNVSVFSVSLWF